jgi:hypothetical protein
METDPSTLEQRAQRAERRAERYHERMEKAGSVMERMDHKDALYYDLGYLALMPKDDLERETEFRGLRTYDHNLHNPESETAGGEVPRPRTRAERRMDKRIQKKRVKMLHRQADLLQKEKIYGRQVVGKPNYATKYEKIEQRDIQEQRYRDGEISRPELEVELAKINAKKTPVQRREIEKMRSNGTPFREGVQELERNTERASIGQPILSRWRDMRRSRAIEKIKKNHHKAEAQRDYSAQLRAEAAELGDEE